MVNRLGYDPDPGPASVGAIPQNRENTGSIEQACRDGKKGRNWLNMFKIRKNNSAKKNKKGNPKVFGLGL